jgi:predicted metal-dependent HD superfamily phosphohydrolase
LVKKNDFPEPLDDTALADTWASAWAELGRPAPLALRLELQTAWREAHRRYHDLRHLRECMALWLLWQGECERPGEVAVALWFHDAIHDPKESGNELRSASWAARELVAGGVALDAAQRVYELVMATRHDAPAKGPDAELVVDIDLAILGSPSARFERYDQDIRKEYEWVPGFRFRLQRAHVLKGFLDRAQLYHGASARDMLERQARLNLSGAISRLEQ